MEMVNEIRLQFEMTKDELAKEKVAVRKTKGLKIEGVEKIEDAVRHREQHGKGVLIDVILANPELLVTLLASIATIANRLWDYIKMKGQQETWIGLGIRIDLRKTPPRISRTTGVPSGTIVIIDKNGDEITYAKAIEKEEDLVPILTEVLSPSKKRKPVKKRPSASG